MASLRSDSLLLVSPILTTTKDKPHAQTVTDILHAQTVNWHTYWNVTLHKMQTKNKIDTGTERTTFSSACHTLTFHPNQLPQGTWKCIYGTFRHAIIRGKTYSVYLYVSSLSMQIFRFAMMMGGTPYITFWVLQAMKLSCPCWLYCGGGREVTIKWSFISMSCWCSINAQDEKSGFTPLHLALVEGRTEYARILRNQFNAGMLCDLCGCQLVSWSGILST